MWEWLVVLEHLYHKVLASFLSNKFTKQTHALAIEHVNTALAGPMIFKGPITPNGPNFTLSSTAEVVLEALK